MGTEVHYKNSSNSMRNIDEDSNNSNWHLFNTLTNGHYYDGFTPRAVTDAHLGHDKDELKQKMLQHEAVFKNQVHELHRIYRRQTDMMEEVKRKEFRKYQISIDTSSSSSLIPSQKPYEDANRWHNPSFLLANSTSRPSIFGVEISNSTLSCSKGNGSKDCEIVECRPSKVRKKLFDLQLPAHEYIEPEEGERIVDNQTSEISSYPAKENGFLPKNGVKNTASGQHFMRSNGLADLNEPVYSHDVNFLGPSVKQAGLYNLPFDSKSNKRDRFSSCMWEPGNNRSNMIPSDTMQHLHGKDVKHRGIHSEISSQIQDRPHFNQTPVLFNTSSAYPFNNSWSQSGSFWGKSNDSLTHKLTPIQTHLSFLSSPRNPEVFKEKWHRNGNGYHNGSSSRVTSVGLDYRNYYKADNDCQKIFKGSNFVDLTDNTKCMELNTVQTLSNGDENSRKCVEDVLPWLKPKPTVCKNGVSSGDVLTKKDDSSGTNRKLLGLPIFGNFCSTKNDALIEHRGIDINVAWDDVSASEHNYVKTDGEIKNFKNNFDLNSCVSEDNDLLVTESVKSSNKMTMKIDLERPPVSEIEEEDQQKETELEKIAAEAIIAMSSQQNHVGSVSRTTDDNDNENENNDEPLLWFVEVIRSCEKNIVPAIRETDEYEMLTLKLEETKEEEYMPTPLVPDFHEPDEVGPALTTSSRPQRGKARRGRPRRDFQSDILPGITSLSRHEITEDLQVFGGLMRATRHSWNFGSRKRNGKRIGARGRQKVNAVKITPAAIAPPSPPLPAKHVNKVEMVGLDERSLTGWGKTTRRPRRQRCAAGNSVAAQLT